MKINLGKTGDEFYIDNITVYLYGAGYFADPKKISEVCRERFGKECIVIYK